MRTWLADERRCLELRCSCRSGMRSPFRTFAIGVALLLPLSLVADTAEAFTIAFEAAGFGLAPTFSNVRTFEFSIELPGPLAPGVYDDPLLVGIEYQVSGSLAATPSGFPAFNLRRTIGGAEFYDQGSSLHFEISAAANLSDGLQLSELVGNGTVLIFNGREVGTGRYHPALLELAADGTGLIRNSNNFGGINPASMEEVDVQIGEEYVTALGFNPSTLTLAVPEASTGLLIGLGLALVGLPRRSSP